MAKTRLKTANRNVKLYVFMRIFAKRVFLPLSAIYFMDSFGFTIKEIGILAIVFATVQVLAEVPTGYFADRFARVTSIRVGALLNIVATLLYVFSSDKSGIFVGQIFEALGYSFFVGAGEALIHDSLVVRRDVGDYSKILSRAQSVSLFMNAGIIALVPMTYRIDPRLPFLLGTLAYSLLFVTALFMHDLRSEKPKRKKVTKISLRAILTRKSIISFGILFGIIGALYTAPSDMINLSLRSFGVKPELLGWIYAGASIFGAIVGIFIHNLKKLSFRNYMIFDCLILSSICVAGSTGSALILSLSLAIVMAFWRYRRIIYQDHLLTLYPTKYKATLLSAMSNAEQLHLLWMPLAAAMLMSQFGFQRGLAVIGVFVVIVSPLYVFMGTRVIKQNAAKHKS